GRPGESLVKVAARRGPAGEAVIEVSDNGCGMDSETLRRAVEPFFTTRAPRGSGLGLSVCHGMMGAFGGKMELESKPGQGTVARISLPKAAAAAPAPLKQETAPAGAPLRGQILVLDDDPMVRSVLMKVLEADHSV